MQICNDGHDEIVYEGRLCPACGLVRERDGAQIEAEKLQTDLDAAQDDFKSLYGEKQQLDLQVAELEGRLAMSAGCNP